MTTLPPQHPDPDPRSTPARPPLLVGDADRARVQDRLSRAVGLGELTLDEFDDRVQAALHARTAQDLQHLLVDLPSAGTVLSGVPAVLPSDQVPVRAVPPLPKVKPVPTDAWIRWAALAALMIAIWVAVGIPTGAWYPWPIWPILGTATCAIRQSVDRARIVRAGIGT